MLRQRFADWNERSKWEKSQEDSEIGIKGQGDRETGRRTERTVADRSCRTSEATGKNLDFILNAM